MPHCPFDPDDVNDDDCHCCDVSHYTVEIFPSDVECAPPPGFLSLTIAGVEQRYRPDCKGGYVADYPVKAGFPETIRLDDFGSMLMDLDPAQIVEQN